MTLPGLVPQWTLGDRLRKAREIVGLNQSEMSDFATRALAYEGNLRSVQTLLGHASPATTAVYTAVADDTLTATVNAL